MGKLPRYHVVEGVILCAAFSPEAFRSALAYKPRDDDIIVSTFPKCGTTWTQNLISLIFRKGQPFDSFPEFLAHTPFIDMVGAEAAETMPRPGVIKTHLSYELTPRSPSAKYIYVCRNPKDACVSHYYHTKGFQFYNFDGPFEDFFEIYIKGEVEYGDYFDHILSWYAHRDDPNILFLTFEEMKEDTRGVVLKIAKFLGEEWWDMLRKNEEILDNVLKYSTVSEMKKVMKYQDVLLDMKSSNQEVSEGLKHLIKDISPQEMNENQRRFEFVRKGAVGDWKNHFTAEQARRMDEKTKLKLQNTTLLEYWKNLGLVE